MQTILTGIVYGQLLAAVIVVLVELVVTLLFWIGVELGWQFVVWCTHRLFGGFVPVPTEDPDHVR